MRARTAKVLSEDERLVKSLTELIDQRTQAAKYMNPDARREAMEYVDTVLKSKRSQIEAKIAEEQRIERFQQSRSYQLVKEHAESFGRSPPLGSDPQAVALALAIASSNDYTDPDEQSRHYFSEISRITEVALKAFIETREQQRTELAAKQLETATTSQTVSETQKQLEQAKGLADGN